MKRKKRYIVRKVKGGRYVKIDKSGKKPRIVSNTKKKPQV